MVVFAFAYGPRCMVFHVHYAFADVSFPSGLRTSPMSCENLYK